MKILKSSLFLLICSAITAFGETAGSGSYLTSFPGTDSAGRNSYPAGSPALSGKAASKPAPTNEWYSNELAKNHGEGIFNYPMALKPLDNGLAIIRNMEYQAITAENPFIVSVDGVSATQTTISDYTDWTVTINWGGASASMEATIGQGMPMVYFTKGQGTGDVRITVNAGQFTAVQPNIVVLTGCYNRSSYALFAPAGASWTITGNIATSNLGGKNYWTVAMLPENCDAVTTATQWASHAFAFPADTYATPTVDLKTGTVRTTYTIVTEAKEGDTQPAPLIGLLPHHWANLASTDVSPGDYGEFSTVRGALKLTAAHSFTTELGYSGILNVLPAIQKEESGYRYDVLTSLIDAVLADNGFSDWTDSYNDGQLLNRLAQTVLVAREAGYESGATRGLALLKAQLEKWFTANVGDKAFVFYYHAPWHTLLAYPAGHGQDSNINDHNFHYGYFIEAAATVAFCDPQWVEKWGPMVDLLVADVANLDRANTRFPYLRSFSVFSGHCWANGLASLGLGNDQESSAEAMMSHAAMIKWGEATGNTALRDAAIWMYATELSAIEEYWFDTQGRNRPSSFQSALASRIFANGYDDENFWGGGIAGSYGIQVYPVQPSSLYLARDREYALKLWESMCSRTGILTAENNPNIWYDAWTQYLSMLDPSKALNFYNSSQQRMGLKFGSSEALTYYWIHSLAVAGSPVFTVTADSPTAAVFENGDTRTYMASNLTATKQTVRFSDGTTLSVNPYSTATYTNGTPEVANPENPGTEEPGGNNGDGDEPGSGNSSGEDYTVTGTEASEGSFRNAYTIGFTTLDGGKVRVSARFEDRSAYVGFDGPWLFNETNGFAEIRMSDSGDGLYTAVLSGLTEGQTIKVRVKIAFAGGLAVTKQYTYVVGYKDKSSGLSNATNESWITLRQTESALLIHADEEAEAMLFNLQGRMVATAPLFPGQECSIGIGHLPAGVYILQVRGNGSRNLRAFKIYCRNVK